MESKSAKNFPVATEEIAKMFGLHQADVSHEQTNEKSAEAPTDLPIATASRAEDALVNLHANDVDVTSGLDLENSGHFKSSQKSGSPFLTVIRNLAPYVFLAVIGVFVYYFFFSTFDFSKLLQRKAKTSVVAVKESALSVLEKQNAADYLKWVKSYYFDVTDPSVLEMEADNSGNGLSNFQKYLLKLNPKAYDSSGLGISDSEALSKGINPLSGGEITPQQKEIMEKYVDMEVVMNRLTLYQTNVAGVRTVDYNSAFVPSNTFRAYNPNYPEQNTFLVKNSNSQAGSVQGVNTEFPSSGNQAIKNNIPGSTNIIKTAPKTGSNNQTEVKPVEVGVNGLEIDETVPGKLEISSIGVSVPVIWTKSTKNFTTDLQNGVVHYPGTALPGYLGTSYISGHSSNYKWAKGNYNEIFATLNDIPDNASFTITVRQKNGSDAILHYVVTSRKEFKPTDQAQFKNSGKSVVALSTCWPVGSTAKRLVLFGELTQVEK